ncbi:hypothetical protein ACJRO7_013556 [Eucalyptus globulus]|uniref:TIR domain-containing protein n=1 Tax=Eucalyptus globulus TaxID=34317 RepID=A0ABD3L3G8_EUCGL
MGNHSSKQQSSLSESKSPLLLLPSSDSLKKIDVPSASGANSDPSASSTFVNGDNYYVFLSFRGPDTRKGFVSCLYHRLLGVGLPFHPNFVFRDDEDLPFGQEIAANLLSAIERSKISIPVISENYAASEWCLRELIHIMKCKESGGQIVLPVLYKVKTDDVKHMQGKFGKAFKSSMHRFKEDVKQQGPEALRKALTLRVYELEKFSEGDEGKLVEVLVRVTMGKLQRHFLPPLPGNLVGIEDHVDEVMKLVGIAHPGTRIIWIWGIGGIGKTTLATSIYNKLVDKFQCRSFLRDIEETIRNKGIEHVQSRLISDTLEIHDYVVRDPNTGINNIQFNCAQKKVLLVLDNVDHPDHLNMLIGGCKFRSGSRIIVTSHMAIKCLDKAMSESTYLYKLKEMNFVNSLLLFSTHAFEGKPPPKELVTLSRDIVATTGGHPLALKVIGSLLKEEEDQRVWREMLKELSKAPHMTVQQKLKVSYDALKYEEQQMFLDIACFLDGTDQRIATYLWDDLGFSPISGLARMVELSLIKFDEWNELTMHDQLRGLGRAIAHPPDKKPWDWSKLWDEEAMKVLGRKEENENIEALRLDKRGSREFIKQESFKKMPNLKFLHVKDVDFDGDFEGSLVELRWLKWQGCRNDSFEATNFHLEKLVVLDLSGFYKRGSSITENWRGWSSIKMERLKVLNLSGCDDLRSTPNLSAFKNLEMLILKQCSELEEIDPSIRDVKRLVSLNLSFCRSLKKLPKQLGELEKLEELFVRHTSIKEIPPCIGSLKKLKGLSAGWLKIRGSPLVRIPSSIGKLGELLKLNLSYTSIKELPESIGELNKLKILKISNCHIKRLPSSIGKLQSLQELLASHCWLMEGQIHLDKGGLSSLKTLDLRCSKFSGLPENLDQLSSLKCLDLRFCGELESLPKLPFSLSYLRLTCRSNELASLSHLKHLQELVIFECKSLQSIPSLSHLKHLQTLELYRCDSLQSIPELPSCIRKLHIWGSPKLERLPNLSDFEFLLDLHLEDCYWLKKLDGLEHLKSLRSLTLSIHPGSMGYGVDAEDAKVDNLHAIRGLEILGSLELVDISWRKHIQVLDLSKSEHLKQLIVRDCKSLVEIRCPSKFLKHLNRRGCKSLKKLPDFWREEIARS